MTTKQRRWLCTTTVRVRRVAFHASDAALAALLHDPKTLVIGRSRSGCHHCNQCYQALATVFDQQAAARARISLTKHLLCRAQVASMGTLEDAEGAYVTKTEPLRPLLEAGSMDRFGALRSLWLRQVNDNTLKSFTPRMPATLRREAAHSPF